MTTNSIRCAEISRDCLASDDGTGPTPRWMCALFTTLPGLGTVSSTRRTAPEFLPTVADVNLCFCILTLPFLRFTLLLPCFSRWTGPGRVGLDLVSGGPLTRRDTRSSVFRRIGSQMNYHSRIQRLYLFNQRLRSWQNPYR
jgi:hypothetical protein